MARGAPKFKIKGVTGLKVALDALAMATVSKAEMMKATKKNGKLAEAQVRSGIRSGINPRNADLTQAIKGSDKPLVDSSELFNSISSEVMDEYSVFVGVNRTNGLYNVAAIVHEGATIRVTPKMRGLFNSLFQVSIGRMNKDKLSARGQELYARNKDWRPLRESTTVIKIPGRKFIDIALKDPDLIAKARANWEASMKKSFSLRAEQGRKSKD